MGKGWGKAACRCAGFEEMKLRMLNGSHSFLAYLGCLAGYAHISDCMQDAGLVMLVRHLMVQEQASHWNAARMIRRVCSAAVGTFSQPRFIAP
jgi:hypothetical protein